MILIVDDDYDVASLIDVGVHKIGLTASFFTDPLLALEKFRADSVNYDLVISDVRMPVMNGYEFVKQIKKIRSSVKILLMSAFEYSNSENFLASEIEGFLEKPISLHKLNETVLNCLGRGDSISHLTDPSSTNIATEHRWFYV